MNGNSGTRRTSNTEIRPRRSSMASTVAMRAHRSRDTPSRPNDRASRNATHAPRVAANTTTAAPTARPKSSPLAMVRALAGNGVRVAPA